MSAAFVTSSPGRYAVRDFVYDFIDRHGYSPSYMEIGAALGLSSLATIHKHVHNLAEEGLLTLDGPRRYRRITLPHSTITVACPACGHEFRPEKERQGNK